MPPTWTPDSIAAALRSYQPACIIMAAAELDFFSALAATPTTAAALAAKLQLDPRGTVILLDALAALGLLNKSADVYALAPGVADVLTPSGKLTHHAMTLHQATCLRKWSRLADTIKSGTPTQVPPSVRGATADHQAFIEAMNDVSGPLAPALVADINTIPFTHLLDVGGATGTYTIAFLAANPHATATLFDLPSVIPLARKRLADAKLNHRVTLAAGDFTTDPLPSSPRPDYIWVSAIIHQQSRKENVALYAKCLAALAPGGHISIRDMVMDDTHTQPVAGAIFAVNMLAATHTGNTFSLTEIRADLESAGFTNVQQIRQDPAMAAVVVAEKAS